MLEIILSESARLDARARTRRWTCPRGRRAKSHAIARMSRADRAPRRRRSRVRLSPLRPPGRLQRRLPRGRERSGSSWCHAHLRPQLGDVVEHADGEHVVVPRGRERARPWRASARDRRDPRARRTRPARRAVAERGLDAPRRAAAESSARRAACARASPAAPPARTSLPHADASTRPPRDRRRCRRRVSARPMIAARAERTPTPL